ncbi:MAG TPA: hypothetical protein DD738_01880 [Ruminiclostridium sp.]|nr:hypothetical protein [Ruminiclostridium sp.]
MIMNFIIQIYILLSTSKKLDILMRGERGLLINPELTETAFDETLIQLKNHQKFSWRNCAE